MTGEMEPLLKFCLDDQAQSGMPLSQAIIPAKGKSLCYDLKKQMGDSAKDEPLISASSKWYPRVH